MLLDIASQIVYYSIKWILKWVSNIKDMSIIDNMPCISIALRDSCSAIGLQSMRHIITHG